MVASWYCWYSLTWSGKIQFLQKNIKIENRANGSYEFPPYQIVHVGLRLGELHLVHALPSVPMEESLAPEHRSELLRDPLEQLLGVEHEDDEVYLICNSGKK